MGKGSAPKPPDPLETAAAQTGQNIGTAVANKALGYGTQTTPYGTQTVSAGQPTSWTDPLSGKVYTLPGQNITQTLSPQQQGLYDQQTRAGTNTAKLAADQSEKLGAILGKPVNLNGAPQVTAPEFQTVKSGNNQFSKDRAKVEQALLSRVNPQLDRDQSALENRLVNQGIGRGTEAWTRAMGDFGQNRNDAYMQAVLGGGQEQSRLAGLNLAATGFNNDQAQQQFGNQRGLRADYLNERYANRNQPINEIAALLGTGQVTNPNFAPQQPGGVPTTDYAGLVNQNYQQQLANYQTKQQQSQGMLGGLFGLGAAGITGAGAAGGFGNLFRWT